MDMRLYNKLMNEIPEDAITPSLVLHNMVEQVCETVSVLIVCNMYSTCIPFVCYFLPGNKKTPSRTCTCSLNYHSTVVHHMILVGVANTSLMSPQVDSTLAPPTNDTPTDGLHVELNKAFADILSTLPQSDANKEVCGCTV